jgi:hypothetical protein
MHHKKAIFRICASTLLLAAVVCTLPGCGGTSYDGPERAAVKGNATLNGNPIVYGQVNFSGGGRNASGLIKDGSYSIPEEQGPNLGAYKVQITGYESVPPGMEDDAGEDDDSDDDDDDAEEDDDVDLDDMGGVTAPIVNQTVDVEITSGENVHDFDLKQ